MKQRKTSKRQLISLEYALKRLLRNKANYEVLEGFLSELLRNNVSVKKIGKSESSKEHAADMYDKVDILVKDESNEVMLIELLFTQGIDYLLRMTCGTGETITKRMLQGKEHLNVQKIYLINIVYSDLEQGNDYVYHGKTLFTGLHENDELSLSRSQCEIFGKRAADICLEYYLLKVNNFNDKTKDRLDEWIYYLKHNTIKEKFKAKGLDKAREVLDINNLTPKEQKAYGEMLRLRNEKLSR
jgi:hypothetical protein